MPYIKQEDRERVLKTGKPLTAGELNYAVSFLIVRYAKQKGLCYQTINDIIGVLESAKAEFQRRIVGPYEDKKIKENGDL